MKLKKESIGNLVKVIVFLAILFALFLCFTYLFRNTDRTTRGSVLEYYEEEENSLDVVFIGASNINRYWDPLRAWNNYGYTSRNYAPTGMQASTYLAAIKSALQTQDPKLVVLEARMFTKSYAERSMNVGARHLLDSLDYDLFRMKQVQYYSETMGLSWEESLSFYIDLIQYHDNYNALINPKNWSLVDNRVGKVDDYEGIYKGYMITSGHAVYEDPTRRLSRRNGELEETALKLYTDVIEYCKEEEIPLVIVASPIVVSLEGAQKLNSLEEIAEGYGVEFVNTNKLYREMGIDFTQDFYDKSHVNVLGANKFTDYFSAYLDETYDLPDHREDTSYESWNVLYEKYIGEKERAEEKVKTSIAAYENVVEMAAEIRQANNPAEWIDMAKDSQIGLLLVANENLEGLSLESRMILKSLGATDPYLEGTKRSLKVIYNDGVQYSASVRENKKGTIGSAETKYIMATEGDTKLIVAGKNYFDRNRDGIQIVALNMYTGKVFDRVYLSVAEDGSLKLEHLTY